MESASAMRAGMVRGTGKRFCAVLVGMLGLWWPATSFAQSEQVPVAISLPDVEAAPGTTFDIPVRASDVTGLSVVAVDLIVRYDARILTATGIVTTNTFTNQWLTAHSVTLVEGHQDTVGRVSAAMATSDLIPTGAGTLVKLTFSVSDSAEEGRVSPLEFVQAALNDGDPETAVGNGSVTIRAAGPVGDFNEDCRVDFQDFLMFIHDFGSSKHLQDFDPVYDLDGNGHVNFSDFLIFVSHFGERC